MRVPARQVFALVLMVHAPGSGAWADAGRQAGTPPPAPVPDLNPQADYERACAQAREGKADAALAALVRLAGQGLYFDPAAEPGLDALRALPGYPELAARFRRNLDPVGAARREFMVPDPDFIADGIAHDPDTGAYFASGVHRRSIVRVRQGRVRTLTEGGAGGMLAPFGMTADPRRRLLWVAHAGVEEMRGAAPGDIGRTGIVAFDLDSGQVRRRALLEAPGRHGLRDLALAGDGRLYASDSAGGRVYRFDTGAGTFEPLTAPGALQSPRGLALSRDDRTLYIADHARGLFALDLDTGALARLSHPDDIHLHGIEGLVRHGDSLVAVQNGHRPHRVLHLRLADGGRQVVRARVLASNLPSFEVPTRGVVVGHGFAFVANSQWNRFDENRRLPDPGQLQNPVVLHVPLGTE